MLLGKPNMETAYLTIYIYVYLIYFHPFFISVFKERKKNFLLPNLHLWKTVVKFYHVDQKIFFVTKSAFMENNCQILSCGFEIIFLPLLFPTLCTEWETRWRNDRNCYKYLNENNANQVSIGPIVIECSFHIIACTVQYFLLKVHWYFVRYMHKKWSFFVRLVPLAISFKLNSTLQNFC